MKEKRNTTDNPFYSGSGFRILGIGRQEAIKYFFGGNATIAIIVIALIIIFLVKESATFFPQYRDSLELYRKSGQEFVDFSDDQLKVQKELRSLSSQAREYEIEERLGALYRVASVHSDFKAQVLKLTSSERKAYKRAKTKLDSVNTAENSSIEEKTKAQENYNSSRDALKSAAQQALAKLDYSDLSNSLWATDEKYLDPIRESIAENLLTGQQTDFLKDIAAQEEVEKGTVSELKFIRDLAEAKEHFSKNLPAFDKFVTSQAKIASQNKAQAVNFVTAQARRDALESKLAITSDAQTKERTELEIKRIIDIAPDYATLNEPLYQSLEKHQELCDTIKSSNETAFALVPDASQFQSKIARKKIDAIEDIQSSIDELFAKKRQQMEVWDHTKDYPLTQAITGFFFGTKWVTNSSWQDIYGLLPLLAGSVSVAVIALVISIPFSVGGAIYVNRLSSSTERQFIKPCIEFIGAIPSIVLAFFGVVVLGTIIQEYSQSPLLSWIPGFPVEGRLTILNASLLLALMSIPTIFTLCEDALNNVPSSYKEASLALGATKVQTVTKVILPGCASGIIAAVLLGFGRIIGETMVVLLVMGGRIAIPKSFTDPAHSMTGILAQEISEVDRGSLHWGALFMVGFVLFSIALTLNYISQRVLKRFTKHG